MIKLQKIIQELKPIQPVPDGHDIDFEFSFEGHNPETIPGRLKIKLLL